MKRIAIAAAALSAMLGGCGPSAFSVWRVSMVTGSVPQPCYPGGTVPTSSQTIAGLQVDLGTVEIFEGSDPDGNTKYYLVGGRHMEWNTRRLAFSSEAEAFEGVYEDGSYKFEATITLIDKDQINNPTRVNTTIHKNVVTLTPSGSSMTGVFRVEYTSTCSGQNCGTYNTDHPQCTIENNLRAEKVEADNIFVVNGG